MDKDSLNIWRSWNCERRQEREGLKERTYYFFMGYSEDHAKNVFQMFNPETSRIAQSCNIIWLGRMYHTRQDADLMQQLLIVTVPISIHDASVDAEIQKL
jgi:hypothetical protein